MTGVAGQRSVSRLPPYLVARFASWRALSYEPNRIWIARLAEDGQHPRTMVVSCCDSRVETVRMFGAEPGDLFVVRNVANLVPPYLPDHSHHGTSAAVEYAVTVLKVAHILVVGHSNCGGVAACDALWGSAEQGRGFDPETECDDDGHGRGEGGFIARWIEMLRPGWERVRAQEPDPARRQTALEHEAVRTSIANLESFPFVARAVAEERLSLHGAWVDIHAGELYALDPVTGQFAPVTAPG